MTARISLMAAVVTLAVNVMAQKTLTLEELLSGGSNYHNLAPQSKRTLWWGETPAETTPDGARHLLTGEDIVTVVRLNEIAGDTIIRNGHGIELPYAGKTIAKVRTKAGIWLVDWEAATAQRIDTPAEAQNVDFCSASRRVAYTIGGNLYVGDQQITEDGSTDGSEDIVYGTSVHRDEWGISGGTFWSPDGRHLAFYRMDQSMVPSYPQVDITRRIAQTTTDHYPMAGEQSHRVTVGIWHADAEGLTWLDMAGAEDDYHTNIAWAPDGRTIYIMELNRDQNHARLVAYDALSGDSLGTLYEERHDKYVEPMTPIQFLPWDDGKALLQSQRDGYNHLYVLDVASGQLTQLTHGEWVVQRVVGFDRQGKRVVYLSNEGDPRRSTLHTVDMWGKRAPLGHQDGVHRAKLSHSGAQVIDEYSAPDVPRVIDVLATDGTRTSNALTAADRWTAEGYAVPQVTSGSIKAADGVTDLYYRMVLPLGFDPAQKYPTVVYVYGGPHAHNVDASWHWGMRGWEAHMAARGYIVFVLDNRGSEWRGREFEQVTFRHLGDEEMRDQMRGVEYLRGLPYVDGDRMGVHGWSFGGYMTTNLMCSYPDAFKVGVAGGPVIDWKYYEVMYGERYMDTPQQNPEGYATSSLLGKAKNLTGRLQIIFGYNDPVCVPQHTLSFVRACADAGTQPDLFLYPGDGHNMFGRDQIHLHERITRYFEDYLK